MGQQQLLLLVLATVIVGLATVAGIQAFNEGQTQATRDALVQRGIEIGNDMLAAHEKPSQFGGVDITSDAPEDIAQAAGYDSKTPSADGAGNGASCQIGNGNPAKVKCADDGSYSQASGNEYVEIDVDPNSQDVSVLTINDREIGS